MHDGLRRAAATLAPFAVSVAVVFAVSMPDLAYLSRFPWQDLFWNDLQLHNSWRWFAETLQDSGVRDAASAVIDFRINVGDNVATSLKAPPMLFDVGAWCSWLTGNQQVGFHAKFLFYGLTSALGLGMLVRHNDSLGVRNAAVAVFSIVLASVLLHPNLHHEVGPLNQWVMMTVPAWCYLLGDGLAMGRRRPVSYALLVTAVTALGLGSTDLFLAFYLTAVFGFYLFRTAATRGDVQGLLIVAAYVALVVLIEKSAIIFGQFLDGDPYTIRTHVSWSFELYMAQFLKPLLRSIVVPEFNGPITVFLNGLILVLLVVSAVTSRRFRSWSVWAPLVATILGLVGVGMFLHYSDAARERLPSVVRYHLGIIPFLVASVLARFGSLGQRFSQAMAAPVCLVPAILVGPALLLLLNALVYRPVVTDTSRATVSPDLTRWLTVDLPACVDGGISRSMYAQHTRSYVFVGTEWASLSESNDALQFLIEQPRALGGRTFNQWRYSTSPYNHALSTAAGRSGLTSWPFSVRDMADLRTFADATGSPFVLSTAPISDAGFDAIVTCVFPSVLADATTGNPTLASSILVYYRRPVPDQAHSAIRYVRYESNRAIATVACPSELAGPAPSFDVGLPIAFYPALYVEETHAQARLYADDTGGLVAQLNRRACSADGHMVITIRSRDSRRSWSTVLLGLVMVGGVATGLGLRRPRAKMAR